MLDIYSSLSLIWRYSYCPVFQGATSAALKSHCIEWKTTSEPDGFTHLNEQFQSYTPYQFAISRNEHGRIHGFFIGNVFYVVWLDPNHQLYPGE
ncbi:hypothetical protein NL354_18735 [Klebsiella pneumoniae]|nr:hypothetical protein [Klebsiella pneumoniae]